MTHLNIQQGSNVEIVTTLIIKKLYDAALSVPEPLEGELDAAYMSGNLLVGRAYRSLVEYLTDRFDDLNINVTVGYYIPFEDSAVLNVLLANNIGSDGIGVTEAEAANAILTSAMFKNNTDITSFDEFKYFTKANTNPPNLLFMGCSNLSSVDLSNITTCSNEEFRNSGLTGTLNLPNLTSIGNYAFLATGITSILSLGSVSSIGNYAFDNCRNLSGIVDLSNTHLTSLGIATFRNTAITGVIFPKLYFRIFGISLSAGPFSSVRTLTVLKGLDGLTTVNSSCVANIAHAIYMGSYIEGSEFPVNCSENTSSSINLLYLPAFTHCNRSAYIVYYSSINDSFFSYRITNNNATMTINLLYFKALQSIQAGMFHCSNIKNLVINNTTPPSFDTSSATYHDTIDANYLKIFGNSNATGTSGMIIYVPDSAVTTYLADSNYNLYVIRGINEINPDTNQPYLTRYATNALWEAAGSPSDALIEEYMD